MMTDYTGGYATEVRHNSLKRSTSLYFAAALAAALALSVQTPAMAGNENGGSMYQKPIAEQPLQEVRAAAIERGHPHIESNGGGGVFAMVTAAAGRHGVPVALAHAIIKIESGYNCRARSRYGAAGIGQILPSSARAEGVSGNLYDCGTGLEASMRYLKHAIALYGSGCAAASAYNTGLGGRGRCTGYGRNAMRLAQGLR